ncbi:MAG TPA: PQQ-dependent sugar dehydrogenase [Planctomycetota bacterium]|nr:PQQ-dependent sugar dehydrogenase [Planctomycetota bacterium]
MKKVSLLLVLTLSRAVSAALPSVALTDVFPALTLDRPVWMTEAPDGSQQLLIVEQRGRILRVPKGSDGSTTREFFNISSRRPLHDDQQNEEGLLGFALHPEFTRNRLFYVFYSQQNPKRCVISEFKSSSEDLYRAEPDTERVLLEVPKPFWNHNGGQVSFGPDGYLYTAIGDGGAANDPFNNGQNTASLLGKMLRIDVNHRPAARAGKGGNSRAYGIPADNPFAKQPYGVCPEIYAWGLRNVWRFSWDRETGELWAGDVGQDKFEEINIIVKGGNYGWCVRESFHPFKPGPEGAKFVDPVVEYPHTPEISKESTFPNHAPGASVTGGYVYRGKKHPALRGVYVYADYVVGTVSGLRLEQGKLTEQATLLKQPLNVSSFAEDADGELYLISYGDKVGKIFAVEPR